MIDYYVHAALESERRRALLAAGENARRIRQARARRRAALPVPARPAVFLSVLRPLVERLLSGQAARPAGHGARAA